MRYYAWKVFSEQVVLPNDQKAVVKKEVPIIARESSLTQLS